MPIIKKSGFELHPAGIYEGRLISLEEAENLNPDWAPQFQHIFETTGTSEFGGNLTITYYTSQTLSDRSKLGGLVKALGVDLNQLQNGGDFEAVPDPFGIIPYLYIIFKLISVSINVTSVINPEPLSFLDISPGGGPFHCVKNICPDISW